VSAALQCLGGMGQSEVQTGSCVHAVVHIRRSVKCRACHVHSDCAKAASAC
jgi:hypothetical protein